jgi:hypothetical protein
MKDILGPYGIVVVSAVCILNAARGFSIVVALGYGRLMYIKMLPTEWNLRTDNTFPEIVCLALGGIGTREFPINLVFDIAHCDKGRNNASPTAGLDYNFD